MSDPHTKELSLTWFGQMPAEVLIQIGEWLEHHGDAERAGAYYSAALSIDPSQSLAAWRHGQLALGQGNWQLALERLETAAVLAPDHSPTKYLAGLAAERLDLHDSALRYVEAALELDPRNAGAWLLRLRCLAALERWDELRSACRASPKGVATAGEVNLWEALACAALGDMVSAGTCLARISRRVRQRYPDIVRELEQTIASTSG